VFALPAFVLPVVFAGRFAAFVLPVFVPLALVLPVVAGVLIGVLVVELTVVILFARFAFAFILALFVVLVAGAPQAAMETANAATAEIVRTFFIIFLISSKDGCFFVCEKCHNFPQTSCR
jgi:hypothetical protein